MQSSHRYGCAQGSRGASQGARRVRERKAVGCATLGRRPSGGGRGTAGGDVPALPRGRSMMFDARWRAMTMARLYSRCGWTFQRIGAHFGVGPDWVRQLVRVTGYRGGRGGRVPIGVS
jgi:hypothetical protein